MYRTIVLPHFLKQLKELVKKYRTLKDDVIEVLEKFQKNRHPHLGQNIYKVRLKSKSLTRGKSKSFRLMILLVERESFLVPITVYFKGDQQDISRKEINDHLEVILFELRTQRLLER